MRKYFARRRINRVLAAHVRQQNVTRQLRRAATERPCGYCGALGGNPGPVESRDDSTGYHETEDRCAFCAGGAQ